MTDADRIAALEAENAALREANTALREALAVVGERVAALERGRRTHSQNSSQPPSQDRQRPQPRSLRGASGKKPGGQPEHEGAFLQMSATPDRVMSQRPAVCAGCAAPLAGVRADGVERRQVHDLLPVRLEVLEYQGLRLCCPHCRTLTTGAFPPGVTASVQYGPRVRATAVCLSQQHLLPYNRAQAVLGDLLGCALSRGTLAAWVQEAAHALEDVEAAIAEALRRGTLLHADETGLSVQGKGWWLHTASTGSLTHYGVHPKRGREAMDALGILPCFRGVSMHDGWAPYRGYTCRHVLCNAHHLRELAGVAEEDGQEWATRLAAWLRAAYHQGGRARARGQTHLPERARAAIHRRYARLLAQGRAANPPPREALPRRRGRPKQSKAQNLLDRLEDTAAVLAFVDDLTLPFDNNQAERDVRMVKVQQKASGTFRSVAGASAFARIRGYVSTLRKQSIPVYAAIESLFRGQPLLPTLA